MQHDENSDKERGTMTAARATTMKTTRTTKMLMKMMRMMTRMRTKLMTTKMTKTTFANKTTLTHNSTQRTGIQTKESQKQSLFADTFEMRRIHMDSVMNRRDYLQHHPL